MHTYISKWKKYLTSIKVVTVIKELRMNVYRSMDKNISVNDFDIGKAGNDFGFHFGTKESASHRGAGKSTTFLKQYEITFENPLELEDPGLWSLKEIFRQLKKKGIATEDEEKQLMKVASMNARASNLPLPIEQNKLLGSFLESKNRDAIIYDNRGEAGGKAYIIWNKQQIKEKTK